MTVDGGGGGSRRLSQVKVGINRGVKLTSLPSMMAALSVVVWSRLSASSWKRHWTLSSATIDRQHTTKPQLSVQFLP